MADKTVFMIATGASVVVVRGGKRVTINAGGGDNFTEGEIASILRAVPGSLRKPINEGGQSADEDGEDDDTVKKTAKGKKAAKAPKAPAKEKKAAAPAPDADDDDDDDDDDADEDGDI